MNTVSPIELFPHGRWLLCRPVDYDVRYKINPWMDTSKVPDTRRALEQWQTLHHTLLRLGAWVEYVAQGKNVPDMVFTANGGMVRGDTVILPKFRYVERQPEEALFKNWFADHGFKIIELSSGAFEGEGDALFVENTLVGGYGFRTDEQVYEEIAAILSLPEVLKVQLIDPHFYHLDTCFAPIDGKLTMAYAKAFKESDFRLLKEKFEVIEVPEKDAKQFVCNSVVLGKNIVMPAGCDETAKTLEGRGFTVYPVQLDEFIKAGGAAKCLSLRIK